jgi:hypothetical protein
MAAIEHAEDDLFEGAGFLVFFIIVGIVVLVYLSVKSISLPEGLYPFPLFSKFASWVDGVFYGMPDDLKAITKPVTDSVDKTLGAVGAWIDDNLPRTSDVRAAVANSHAGFAQDSEADNPGASMDEIPVIPDVQIS